MAMAHLLFVLLLDDLLVHPLVLEVLRRSCSNVRNVRRGNAKNVNVSGFSENTLRKRPA
jgi:hypothetical protein